MRLQKFTFLMLLLCSAITAPVGADDSADKFFAKIKAAALKDLERGSPAKKIEAAGTLDPMHGPQIAAALGPLLSHPDAAVRLGAAEALWTSAGRKGDIVLARSPLYAALDDVNADVAMNAAGALSSMGIGAEELAPARRRVLDGPQPSSYARFLAARGLIDLEPAGVLMPHLLAWYFDMIEAERRGGSDDNTEMAEDAIEVLVERNDRTAIPVMADALEVTPAATAFLLEQLGEFDPKPEDWTSLLLSFTNAGYRDTKEEAFEQLGKQLDPESLKRWVPRVVPLLQNNDDRDIALEALNDVAGRTTLGLAELEQLVDHRGASAEHRMDALEVIVEAADSSDRDAKPEVLAAARAAWMRLCAPVAKTELPTHEKFKACEPTSYWIVPDEAERSKLLADWMEANPHAESKIEFLGYLERMWSKAAPAAAQIRKARDNSDARVVTAAEAALDRIEPAWRERDARGSNPPKAPVVAAAPKAPDGPEKPRPTQSGKPVDGATLYEAVRLGNVAVVKKIVRADNVLLKINYPGMTGGTPVPIQVAINYCGVDMAAKGLPEIVRHMMSLGANPDIRDMDGSGLLDRAKHACSPEIMAMLVGQ